MKTGLEEFRIERDKIRSNQTEFKVLQLMIQFQRPDDCLRWSTEMISERLGIDSAHTQSAMIRLMKLECVNRGLGQWRLTARGREMFAEEVNQIWISTSKADMEFKTEVLTGTDKHGNETEIKWAALPRSSVNHTPRNSQENRMVNICASVEDVRTVADYYGWTIDIAAAKMQTEEVHHCNRCHKLRLHHRHGGSDGQQWQSTCIECRKIKRQ